MVCPWVNLMALRFLTFFARPFQKLVVSYLRPAFLSFFFLADIEAQIHLNVF